jgi:uncharacterized RDD family membrane protein YckC
VGPTGPRAAFLPRLAGWIIDGVIIGIVNRAVDSFTTAGIGVMLGFVVQLAYSVYFIASGSGQTPGMRIMNIRAIDATTGGRVDPGRAIARSLISIVSGTVFVLGYLWMLWDPERQTWHDKVAGTYVVPTADFPVEAWPG